LAISENEALFNLIGTTYGGDGQSTFALPDLRGRIPYHTGSGFVLGQKAGSEQETLTVNQIPTHTHTVHVSTDFGTTGNPQNAYYAKSTEAVYIESSDTTMYVGSTTPAGGNQPHENMPPFLTVSFIISLFGIFPTQN
jgi:microcystin-dependent protein